MSESSSAGNSIRGSKFHSIYAREARRAGEKMIFTESSLEIKRKSICLLPPPQLFMLLPEQRPHSWFWLKASCYLIATKRAHGGRKSFTHFYCLPFIYHIRFVFFIGVIVRDTQRSLRTRPISTIKITLDNLQQAIFLRLPLWFLSILHRRVMPSSSSSSPSEPQPTAFRL